MNLGKTRIKTSKVKGQANRAIAIIANIGYIQVYRTIHMNDWDCDIAKEWFCIHFFRLRLMINLNCYVGMFHRFCRNRNCHHNPSTRTSLETIEVFPN